MKYMQFAAYKQIHRQAVNHNCILWQYLLLTKMCYSSTLIGSSLELDGTVYKAPTDSKIYNQYQHRLVH